MHSTIKPKPGFEASVDAEVEAVLRALATPSEREWNSELAQSGGIYAFNSIDPRSRSFNLIRGRLLEFKRRRNSRMIGVVSATPNVGKSFVSANIAASLSRDPQLRTFAIDLDLRRGSLSQQFNLVPAEGLSDYLGAGSPLGAFRLSGQELTVVPTRGDLVHSAELLASARAHAFFRAMRSSDPANIYIFDLPPAFANDDAVMTMAQLDSYVLVTEEGQTTEREVRDAVEALGQAKLAGVVLNKFRGGLMSDGYGVDSYYAHGYYASDEKA